MPRDGTFAKAAEDLILRPRLLTLRLLLLAIFLQLSPLLGYDLNLLAHDLFPQYKDLMKRLDESMRPAELLPVSVENLAKLVQQFALKGEKLINL